MILFKLLSKILKDKPPSKKNTSGAHDTMIILVCFLTPLIILLFMLITTFRILF